MKRQIKALALILGALLSAVLLSGCALNEVTIAFEDDGSVQYTYFQLVEENFLEEHGTTVEEAFDVEDRDELLCDTYNGYDFYGKPDVSSIKNFESVDAFAEAMEDDRVTHLIINDDGTYSLVFVIPAREDVIEDSGGDLTERDKENLAWRARFVCPTNGWVTGVEVEGSEEAESALSMDLESHGGVTNIVMTMPVLTEAYQVWVTIDPVLEGTYIHEIWLDFVIPQPGSSMAGARSLFHLDDDVDGLDLGAAEITWMEAVKTGSVGSLSPTVYLPITDPDYKFEAGKQYAYQIDVPAKEGFLLAHDPFVYENGRKTSTFEKTPFSITINSNGSFPVGCTTLRKVSITSAAPVPGMTVSELRSSITVTADQDAIVPSYSVDLWTVEWNAAHKSWDWVYRLYDDYRINPEERYAFTIRSDLAEGFIVETPVTSFSFNRGEIDSWTAGTYTHFIADCIYGTGYPGDIDLDGDVDSQDLTALARHVAKISELESGASLQNADVTGDGVVDAQDLTKLARFVAQIITEL